MKVAIWAGSCLLVFLVVWLAAGWYVSSRFLALGITDYDESEELATLNGLGLPDLGKRAVRIPSGSVSISASFFEHPQSNDCAVVMLPGIGGDRTQVLPALPLFWRLGCHVLAYDPRGTGDSSRVPRTFGFFEKKDNAAVIRWLAAETGLDVTSVGVWGPSFGAAVAILTLDEIDRLSFVIADSTFHSFDQVAHDTIAFLSNPIFATVLLPGVLRILEIRADIDVNEIRPEASIAETSTPVLLIHAIEDQVMDVSHSQKVYEARTTSNVHLELTDWGAGHADSALIDAESYNRLVVEFLARHPSTKKLVASERALP